MSGSGGGIGGSSDGAFFGTTPSWVDEAKPPGHSSQIPGLDFLASFTWKNDREWVLVSLKDGIPLPLLYPIHFSERSPIHWSKWDTAGIPSVGDTSSFTVVSSTCVLLGVRSANPVRGRARSHTKEEVDPLGIYYNRKLHIPRMVLVLDADFE